MIEPDDVLVGKKRFGLKKEPKILSRRKNGTYSNLSGQKDEKDSQSGRTKKTR